MTKKINCMICGRKHVEIEFNEELGHINMLQGEARILQWTDGTQTVDFYCDSCKKEI